MTFGPKAGLPDVHDTVVQSPWAELTIDLNRGRHFGQASDQETLLAFRDVVDAAWEFVKQNTPMRLSGLPQGSFVARARFKIRLEKFTDDERDKLDRACVKLIEKVAEASDKSGWQEVAERRCELIGWISQNVKSLDEPSERQQVEDAGSPPRPVDGVVPVQGPVEEEPAMTKVSQTVPANLEPALRKFTAELCQECFRDLASQLEVAIAKAVGQAMLPVVELVHRVANEGQGKVQRGLLEEVKQKVAALHDALAPASTAIPQSTVALTPIQAEVFEAIGRLEGTDPKSRKKAERELHRLEENAVTEVLTRTLESVLKDHEWGILCLCGHAARPLWKPDPGCVEGGRMQLSHTGAAGKTETHGSFTVFPKVVLVPRPDRRRRRSQSA